MDTRRKTHPRHGESPSTNKPRTRNSATDTPGPGTRHNVRAHLTITLRTQRKARARNKHTRLLLGVWSNSPFHSLTQTSFYPVCSRRSLVLFYALRLPGGMVFFRHFWEFKPHFQKIAPSANRPFFHGSFCYAQLSY